MEKETLRILEEINQSLKVIANNSERPVNIEQLINSPKPKNIEFIHEETKGILRQLSEKL